VVSGGDEFGYLIVGSEQDPLIVGGLHHHVGEGSERGLVPDPDDHADAEDGSETRDVTGEHQSSRLHVSRVGDRVVASR
jgi:hypothetical protein